MNTWMEPVIQFILSQQEADGSFSTFESYPVVNPAAGWTRLPDPSPFIAANILCSLLYVKDARLDAAILRGAQNLIASKEGAGFWRFWPVKSRQHPVPLDMDDTCIVLYVLRACGFEFGNKEILLSNQSEDGYFETWLRPRWKHFFISPSITWGFIKDYRLASPTHQLKHFDYTDREPAVAANVLLYLGDNDRTKACIRQVITEVTSEKMSLQFYDDEMVVYYHIARAYSNGIRAFGEPADTIAERIRFRFGGISTVENEMLCAMAANVLLDFGKEPGLAAKLIGLIAEGDSYPDNWKTHAYFCSKDRNFLSGSPALTAAIFVEACTKLKSVKA